MTGCKYKCRAFVAGLLVLLLQAHFQSNGALSYTASGELTFQQVISNSVIGYSQVWLFTLTRDTSANWQLTTTEMFPYAKSLICLTNITSCDGTNVYSVTYSSEYIDTPYGRAPKVVPLTKAAYPAIITPGCYPVDAGSAVGMIWLTFCGGHYLNRDSTQMHFPNLLIPDPRKDPRAWDCDLKYKLTGTGSGRIIDAAKYVIERRYMRKNAVDYPGMDEPMSDDERESFQRTFAREEALKAETTTTSTFSVDGLTNLNGFTIPLRFHADVGLESASHYSLDRFVGVVTNVVIDETTNLMPPLKGQVTVEDRRMRYKDKSLFRKDVYYTISDRVWLTDTNSSQFRSLVHQHKPSGIDEVSSRPEKFLAIRVLFITLLLVPLVIILRKVYRRAKRDYR